MIINPEIRQLSRLALGLGVTKKGLYHLPFCRFVTDLFIHYFFFSLIINSTSPSQIATAKWILMVSGWNRGLNVRAGL
jgi:hypothetical protein